MATANCYAGRPPLPATALFALVVAIHGPLDIAVTLAAFARETNPVVATLGPVAWLAAKAFILGSAWWVYRDGFRATPRPYPLVTTMWLTVLLLLGVAFVVPNLAILAGAEVRLVVRL